MTVVVDSSAVVAALVDPGPDGRWADELVGHHELVAPHLMAVEVANILRRLARAGALAEAEAGMAHVQLIRLRVQLFDYAPFADRVWTLRNNVTAYDALYVAIAERLDVPLASLDRRLTTAVGPSCRFLQPPPLGR